jgi:hypothetical protein
MLRAAACSLLMIVTVTAPVAAADGHSAPANAAPLASAIAKAAHDSAAQSAPSWAIEHPGRRPMALPALYAGYAVAETLDLVSTRRALAAGATETNPLMRGGNTGAMIAVKAAAGVSTIFFTERAWKKNRVGAILLMVAVDGATSAIAVRNMRMARP